MPAALGIDVYGTIIDLSRIVEVLRPTLGERAEGFAALWRQKQIEYALRRGLMRYYVPFTVCNEQALKFTVEEYRVEVSEAERQRWMQEYQGLPAYPDVDRLG